MKDVFKFIKENYVMVFVTIIIYQLFLTIIFFSSTNLRILAILVVVWALRNVIANYRKPVSDFFKNLFKKQ